VVSHLTLHSVSQESYVTTYVYLVQQDARYFLLAFAIDITIFF